MDVGSSVSSFALLSMQMTFTEDEPRVFGTTNAMTASRPVMRDS
jgi:hypothetical protein